jgi:glutathione S-transferase
MLRLHTTMGSVNGYKVRLLLAILGVEYEWVDVDMYGGEHKREPFLSINRFGQMPALEDGDFKLGDSHACLVYAARKYDATDSWLPRGAEGEAKVAEWMSKSANEIHNGPWMARAKVRRPDAITLSDEEIHARCDKVLEIVDRHLATRDWLALDRATIADISIYCPVSFLPDSGYATTKWKNVTKWLGRVRAIPGAVDPDGQPFP